jgi:restriction system protein
LAKGRLQELQNRLVYSLAMRVLFDIACITRRIEPVQGIALNGHVTFIDKTNGHERTETILSLFVKPDDLLSLRIGQIDPKAAFRALKGSMTANLSEYSPVAPIIRLDQNDGRIVEAREVIGGLRPNENLAAMDWEDFEHLIRELFEKEFAQNGVQVKVTRASRDSGVDAIAFDPDPLRGGKFVIQAKRYTRTVDVSAVRDLYGTLQNEGANRGILVTTSKFGPDSFEFAKGKPISLIDGPNLLALLRKHGYEFSVDLEAARRLNV